MYKLFLILSVGLSSCAARPMFNNVEIKQEDLISHVQRLTETPAPRNYLNIKSLNQTADYIDSVFNRLSDRCESQYFKTGGNEYRNIVCSFGPEYGERIIVGAHYDVCENQPGADDNASGIAGLLEIARLLSEQKPDLNYRIDLVAYTLEEPPFFATEDMGSAHHARMLKESDVDVKVMLCLEMIGYFTNKVNSQRFPLGFLSWFYPDEGNFIALVSNFKSCFTGSSIKGTMQEYCNVDVQHLVAPSFVPGVNFSDHRNFWKQGYKAVMITDTAFYRNPNYHMTTDLPVTLDYVRMAEVIKGIYYVLLEV